MQVVTTDGYTMTFEADGDYVLVSGDQESLDCFTDGVVLAGTASLPDSERPSGVLPHSDPDRPSETILRVSAGTVALWLEQEVLNFL